MIKGLLGWFRKKTSFIFSQNVECLAVTNAVSNKNNNKTYLIDASFPNMVIDTPVPASTLLPMKSVGEAGGGYALGTAQQQAMGLKQIVNDALVYMNTKSPKKVTKWAATSSLTLQSRAGKDINAYYDRNALKFFYFPDNVRKNTVFAADSRTVVSHEFGHALLDTLRPDLWNVMAEEIWAFHESFGDMVAILNNLQYNALVDAALTENGSDLNKSNKLTRLAVDMGIGLYNLTGGSNGELNNCLRDASIKFTYVIPTSLPSDGRDDQLINEPHSFSRVFTSMFYNLLIQMTNVYISEKMSVKDALLKARDTMASYILTAAIRAAVNPRFFKSVCQEMLIADKAAGGKFQNMLNTTFSTWKIIPAGIKILSNLTYDDVIKNIDANFDYTDLGEIKVLRTTKVKSLKLSSVNGVLSMLHNPLMQAEIEVASQSTYYFDEQMILQDATETSQQEMIDSAMNCIGIIQSRNLYGDDEKAQFNMVDGKLVRSKIASCGCNKPNYCIPGAPEYQKPWKPKNNAGCVKCRKSNCDPRPCDCAQPAPPAPPKLGCYASVKTCTSTGYKVGNRISRKVC